MNYCESCKCLCQSGVCPECGNDQLRQAENDDWCFFLECNSTFGKMLNEIFENESIPCSMIPCGNGARSALGLNLENLQLFVPYQFYDRAVDLHDYFKSDPTEDFKKSLIENREKWHTVGMFTEKKLKKKLNIAKDEDLFRYCEEIINCANNITDGGSISSCVNGGHYLFVRASNAELTFNSATYELLHAKKSK